MTDETPIYNEAAFANGFAPVAHICPRCTAVGASGMLCPPCAGEVAHKLRDLDDALVAVNYTGHGFQHGDYRPDVS